VLEPTIVRPLLALLSAGTAGHLLLVVAETTFPHPTAHATLAVHELVAGRHRQWFWAGVLLTLPAIASPWIGAAAAPLALAGLLAYEHAYVQAGQSVPLA
jgi:hypothetical protein